MGEESATRLSRELEALYECAGKPSFDEIIKHGLTQQPVVRFSKASLSDWRSGTHAPSDPQALKTLVDYLEVRAARRNVDYKKRGPSFWESLRLEARRTRGSRRMADRVDALGGSAEPVGQRIVELNEPFDYGVHDAIALDARDGVVEPALPRYVERSHDRRLAEAVRSALDGRSEAVFLVADSSTGKTRACWEAITSSPELGVQWRLWHPIEPSPTQALLNGLASVPPHTVIWLDDAHEYLINTESDVGERIASALRELLRNPERGPVLVLGTMWTGPWDVLVRSPGGERKDMHPQARKLLAGRRSVAVPESFSGPDLEALIQAAATDPRLEFALEQVHDGRITQFLAGALIQMDRYNKAPAHAKAVIHAAVDLRRRGHGRSIPAKLLKHASRDYLSEEEQALLLKDWFKEAIRYCTEAARGVSGPLARTDSMGPRGPRGGKSYRVADYVEQSVRDERANVLGPASLWDALARFCEDPDDLARVSDVAYRAGLTRYAAILGHNGLKAGNPDSAFTFLRAVSGLGDDVMRAASAEVMRMFAVEEPRLLADVLILMREAVPQAELDAWAAQAARQVSLQNPAHVASSLKSMHLLGLGSAVSALAVRIVTGAVPADLDSFWELFNGLARADAIREATAMLSWTPKWPDRSNLKDLANLIRGAADIATAELTAQRTDVAKFIFTLAHRAAASGDVSDPAQVADLVRALADLHLTHLVDGIAARAEQTVGITNLKGVAELVSAYEKANANEAARALLTRTLAQQSLPTDSEAVHRLAIAARDLDGEASVRLLLQAAECAAAGDPDDWPFLLRSLEQADRPELGGAIENLIRTIVESGPGDVHAAAQPVYFGTDQQTAGPLIRSFASVADKYTITSASDAFHMLSLHSEFYNPEAPGDRTSLALRVTTGVTFDDAIRTGHLIKELREISPSLAAEVADRAAAQIEIEQPARLDAFVRRLLDLGFGDQAETLLQRAMDHAIDHELFLQWADTADRELRQHLYAYGREPDGGPASAWTWPFDGLIAP